MWSPTYIVKIFIKLNLIIFKVKLEDLLALLLIAQRFAVDTSVLSSVLILQHSSKRYQEKCLFPLQLCHALCNKLMDKCQQDYPKSEFWGHKHNALNTKEVWKTESKTTKGLYLCLCESCFLHLQLRLQQFEILGPAFCFGIAGLNPQVIVKWHFFFNLKLKDKRKKTPPNHTTNLFAGYLLIVCTYGYTTSYFTFLRGRENWPFFG